MKMKKLALCAMVWCLGLASSFAVSDGEIHARAAVLMMLRQEKYCIRKTVMKSCIPAGRL